MVKIRLKLQGKKGQKSYRVVVANSTAWRGGKTIDEIGFYDPNTNPSTVKLDMDKYNSWVKKGAQPTDQVKAIVKNTSEAK